jgi:hypothetical protein
VQAKGFAWATVVALAVVIYSAASLSGSYPGLLLGIGLIASAGLYAMYLMAKGSSPLLNKIAWFVTITLGFATLIAFIDSEIRNSQMGVLLSYLIFITAAALVVAVVISIVSRLRSGSASGQVR